MKHEYYKKVYIRSEDDLPKEEGYYFVHHKKADRNDTTNFFIDYDVEYWLDHFDWYLLPVEQKPIDVPTDKWIEKKAIISMQREEGDIIKIIDSPYASAFIDGAETLRDEILKRNK